MKKILILALVFTGAVAHATFAQTAAELHATAKTFMKQGDYQNAVLVLNRSLQQEPKNIQASKDLALSYYYQNDNVKAQAVVKPLLDRDDADDQTFQIAGNIYKQLELTKDCEKIYKKGLKKFPESGPLYSELGELQLNTQNFDAIKTWEKGIQMDPNYSRNYYNAAKYYFFTTDKVWSIIYGETFINMEPSGAKTPEIKHILLDSYKKLFTDADLLAANKDKNDFVKNYLTVMNKQAGMAVSGINAESLSMIRTRFILDWFANKDIKMPLRLFDYQLQLLKEGMFDSYNQWLFLPIENLSAYQNWVNTHKQENDAFLNLQKNRMFKVPAGQYYH